MSKEEETLDWSRGEPLENVSAKVKIGSWPLKPQEIDLSECRPPNAPPVCRECE